MSNVIPMFKQEAAEPVVCCRPGSLCYPHRLVNAANLLRDQVAEARAFDAWVSTVELERIAGDVLAVLDAIASECLPDKRETR